MRLTALTIAVASATFAATFAFAPAIASGEQHLSVEQYLSVGQLFGFGGQPRAEQSEIEIASTPAANAGQDGQCRSALQIVEAALRSQVCQ